MDPRKPTGVEIELVRFLLPDNAFPDVDIYREQVDHLMVTGTCRCGCPSVAFAVDPSRARQASLHGNPLLPVEAEAGERENFVQLILFAPHGWLDYLELVYYGEVRPETFPALPDLRLINRWSAS